MQKIIPHLWYDKEAVEAAEFYISVFPASEIVSKTTIHNTPSGSADIVTFRLMGQEFQAISAGPYFKFNPSVSFHIVCKTKEEVDKYWNKLSDGGIILMELGEYPFSERYGWIQDKFGLSWQIIYLDNPEIKPKIIPAIMFVGNVCGRAEEAIKYWTSVFPESGINNITQYEKGEEPNKEGTVKYASFYLAGEEFGAMDSAYEHKFTFNEAISFIVKCDNQDEIDYYWEKLSAVPEAEQCGWLKDKFGLSWQVIPSSMDKLMSGKDPDKIARVTQAFLKMKKFNIAELEKAAEG